MSDERAKLIEAFRLHHSLSSGDRKERLRAADVLWAVETVSEGTSADVHAALLLIDDLLAAPGADPCYLGLGRWKTSSQSGLLKRPSRWRPLHLVSSLDGWTSLSPSLPRSFRLADSPALFARRKAALES